MDRQRLTAHRLLGEAGDDHSIRRALAGTYGIEEADDGRLQSSLLVVETGEDLIHRLRRAVGPPRHARAAQDPVGGLLERSR